MKYYLFNQKYNKKKTRWNQVIYYYSINSGKYYKYNDFIKG